MKRTSKKTKAPVERPKLLPCPCCGGKPTYMEGEGSKRIKCTDCGLSTVRAVFGSFIQTQEEAEIAVAERWNRRNGQPNA